MGPKRVRKVYLNQTINKYKIWTSSLSNHIISHNNNSLERLLLVMILLIDSFQLNLLAVVIGLVNPRREWLPKAI